MKLKVSSEIENLKEIKEISELLDCVWLLEDHLAGSFLHIAVALVVRHAALDSHQGKLF